MIAPGQSIGNYRILRKIGTGGMGAVYLAEHPLIGKRVALKVIHRELAGNREVVSRFFQEARAVNQIGDEHIVEIHDFGVTPECDHFYIMEYLEGATLASILAREKVLGVLRSLHVGAQIAGALAAAHAAGIIHRDLKPDNVMLMSRLGDRDFVKVLDFGLAKVFSADAAVRTAAGVLLGTPQYMSPEACEGKRDLDHRTDIYALGVLLFQMMTGALPFDGESMGEVLIKQVTVLPPVPRGVNPAIPPSVEQILLRCLAKPVDARFPTMQALREALLDPERYLRGAPPIAPARSVGAGQAFGRGPAVMAVQAAPVAAPETRLANGDPRPLPAPSVPLAASALTVIAEHAPLRRAGPGMPALAPPEEPRMDTMRIATPAGYSSRPPRKVWPVVLAAALVLGTGGGVLSVTCFGQGGGAGPGAGEVVPAVGGARGEAGDGGGGGGGGQVASSPAGSSGAGAGAGSNAGVSEGGAARRGGSAAGDARSSSTGAGVGSGTPGAVGTDRPGDSRATPPPVRTARLTIESVPAGAQVEGPGGQALGKTPLVLAWPASDTPATFALRLAGYRAKQKQAVINGNTRLVIELERAPVRRGGSGPRPGSAKGAGASDGLMRPDD